MFGKEENQPSQFYKEKGNTFYKKKAYVDALVCYEKGISLDKNYEELWFNKGLCHKQLKQLSQAKEAFEHALKLDPSYEKARYQINVLALPASIIFGIVDLKLTQDKQVKILELGRGMMSGFTGYDSLYPNNPINKKVEEFILQSFKIPILFNTLPGLDHIDDKKLPLFLELIQSSNKVTAPSRYISEYKGVYLGRRTQAVNADVLVVDNSPQWHLVSEDKYITSQLFSDLRLSDYRPHSKVYPLHYDSHFADDIKKSIPGTKYVIKVPDLCRSEGVVIVDEAELDDTLKFLLFDKNEPELLIRNTNQFMDKLLNAGYPLIKVVERIHKLSEHTVNWRRSESNLFMVEEYCQSIPIKVQNKEYDPTMRVGFIITVDDGLAKFTPLCSYWKLPEKPLGEGDLRDHTISNIKPDSISSVKVSNVDQRSVYKQLNSVLPQVFLKMLVLDMPKMIDEFKSHSETFYQKQGDYLILTYSNALKNLHRYDESFALMKKRSDKTAEYYLVKGNIYANQLNHEKAIQKFTTCVEKAPFSKLGFFGRAQSHIKMENYKDALLDLQIAKELGFDEKKLTLS